MRARGDLPRRPTRGITFAPGLVMTRGFVVQVVVVACASACGSNEPAPYVGFVDAPVSAVTTQVAGKVSAIPVKEGDRVHKGQLLAQLEASTREAAVAEAEANVEQASQAVRVAEANLGAVLPGVRGASADIARARATSDDAELEFGRAKRLAATGAVTQSELDAARARMLEARASLDAMIASRGQAQGKVASANASVSDARVALRGAQAALQLAQAELAQTRVLCPFDGLVVARDVEEGEWAAPGTPLVTVEDTSRPWVRLDVEETQFGTLRIDEAASVRVIALRGTYEGHVSQIGAEGDFALDRDVKRGRPDVRTFLVRVAFDRAPEPLRPGMTAEVRLLGTARPHGSGGQARR